MKNRPRHSRWVDRVVGILLGLALLGVGVAIADGPPAGLISDLRGSSEVQMPGGAWKPAAIMALLPAGTKIRVAAGGKATVSLMKGGVRYKTIGPATVEVAQETVKLLQGSLTSLEGGQAAATRTAALLPANVDIQRMGGVRNRSDSEIVIKIDDTVADVTPAMTWETRRDFDHFEVSVEEQQDAFAIIYKKTIPGNMRSFQVPADATLKFGNQYMIHLVGYGKDGKPSEATPRDIEVLDKATSDRVTAARTETETQYAAAPDDVSPLVVLISVYTENGLTTPALTLAQRVSKARPDSKTLYLLMGKLYERMHDNARAEEMFRKSE
ncbi:MAG: hypothetical protein FJX76_23750 [Armatimonadetes bacterium]|nr:hypothetical protein [Armatimonadota bacterium]